MVPEYFGMISNPSRIDAKRGDHFLEPDWPTRRPLLSLSFAIAGGFSKNRMRDFK